MSKINAESLLRATDIVDVISRRQNLTKRGAEYYGICPFHDDTKESLQVNQRKQLYKCFACNAGGDSIDYLMRLGNTFKEAADELNGGDVNVADGIPQRRQVAKSQPAPNSWTHVSPAPASPKPNFNHYRHGKPSKVWSYTDAENNLVGYVCRFDLPTGEKEVLPYVYATDGKRSEWRWMGFAKPRPIYNLHKVATNPNATVLIVEGEKTADAAQTQLDPIKTVVVAWIGGARAIQHTDWTPLQDRKIIYLSDNDEPGREAMAAIHAIVGPKAKLNKFVHIPADLPTHWDVADKEWAPGELREWMLAKLSDTPQQDQPAAHDDEPPFYDEPPAYDPPPNPPLPPMDEEDDEPYLKGNRYFKFLGYENNDTGTQTFHFFVNRSKTVTSLTASQMSENNLITIADLNFWEGEFPSKRSGFDKKAAMNWLVQTSYDVGIYSDKNIRGRGAWIDEGRIIVHNGSKLIVNGAEMPLGKLDSRYIYKIGEYLGIETDKPAAKQDAVKFINLIKLLNWERDANPYLFAGWCVIAPFCGAFTWRPHIWLTGGAGTGKTWIFDKIIQLMLGETNLKVQGATTEAGLRQLLQQDALPVVFDEMDVDGKQDQDRIQTILALMRSASAEGGGLLAKGTAGGTAKTYRIRSCFAFASISVQVAQQADRTRVSILGMRAPHDKEEKDRKWKQLQEMYQDFMTQHYAARLRARTVAMLPTIITNARTFAQASAAVLGEQRSGDQLGALLAGAYSLTNDGIITYDKAVEWVASKDWSEERSLDRTKDEQALIAHLMEQITPVEKAGTKVDRNIGELVSIAAGYSIEEYLMPDDANARLKRLGLKFENESLLVSNSADFIKKKLEATPWAKNHNKILMRTHGAEAIESTRFGSGVITRAVKIPIQAVLGDRPRVGYVATSPADNIGKVEDIPF